ncbi:MAG TPA: peptide chain release factor N(5)-glutamine methyltransferase [Verrucomicrobiales bacterium]|nr:peptide chain release factor N(5)-glutamine methyltransferase [Verrucomicrobiales bacterium]
MKTVLETIRSGAPWLEKAGVENPRLNMEHLLAKVLGCRRMQLYMDFDRPLHEEHLSPLRDLVKRRGKGEPLQHLLGTAEFCGREFKCDARALIPRPETEELVEKIVAECRREGVPPPADILDMGTGSGVIGLSLAFVFPEARVTLADVSPDALALARENAEKVGLPPERLTFVQSDLFSALAGQRFDIIAANLPYIAAAEIPTLSPEVQRDPVLALDGGPQGTELVERFLAVAPQHLTLSGLAALEVGAGQTEQLADVMRRSGLRDVTAANDLSRRDRFLFGRAL